MHESTRADRRTLIINAVASSAGFVAQLVVAYFMVPILLHGLGDRRYGIWSLVESVLAYLTLFDLGLAASVVRYVAKFETCQDRDSLNRVITVTVLIFTAAGSAVLALALAFGFLGLPMIGVPAEMAIEARWLMVLLGLNLALALPLGVFPCVLDGLGRYPAKTVVRAAIVLLRVPLFLAALAWNGGLIELAAIICACNVLEHLAMAILAWWYLPELRFSPRLADWKTFRMIRGYSVDAFLAMLSGRISFRSDAIVIGVFLAPQFITFFAIASQLIENAKSLLRSITTVMTPAVSTLQARGDDTAIRHLLLQGTRCVLYLIVPIQVGLLILGKPFLTLWLKSPHYADMSYPTLAILTAPLALTISQSVSARILYGIGRLHWFARGVMVEALANLSLSLTLVNPLGIEGVALGTVLPHFVFNIGLIFGICRILEVRLCDYLRISFLKPMVIALIPLVIWTVAPSILPATNWVGLLIIVIFGLGCYGLAALLIEHGWQGMVRCVTCFWLALPVCNAFKKKCPQVFTRGLLTDSTQ